MKLTVNQNDIIGKKNFRKTPIERVYTNHEDGELAVIDQDHAIILQVEDKNNGNERQNKTNMEVL